MTDLENITDEDLEGLDFDDPDAIAAFLAGESKTDGEDEPAESDADDQEEEGGDEPEGEESEGDEAESEQGEKDATPGETEAEPGDEAEQEEAAYIQSKNGKHPIPYKVLQETREERNELRNELQQAQQRLNDLESKSKTMSSALEQHGIDLSAIERGEMLTDEQLAELSELDPAVAKLAKMTMALQEKFADVSTKLGNSAPAVDPEVLAVQQIVAADPDLSAWQASDPDRWDQAVRIDARLQEDPNFQDKSMQERFAEAVKRTKAVFGDEPSDGMPANKKPSKVDAEAIAAQKLAQAKDTSAPTSLSNIGKSPAAEKSMVEQLAELDGDALIERLSQLPPDRVDEILASGEL